MGTEKFGHWFDGDGMICQFSFLGDRVHFRNAYVKTPKYVEETAAQKVLYRGFGTQLPGGMRANFLKMPANPANTSIIYHGGKLLALNEGGRPWALEPGSLDTLGEYDYDGGLAKTNVFSAHGKVHPRTGDYINFGAGVSGFGLSGPKACINIYRIDPQGSLLRKAQVPLDRFPFCHDFALTDRYAIFFINSIVIGGMLGFMLGKNSISDNIAFDESMPMRVVVVDLDTLAVVKEFETAPGAIIHFGNAFERGEEIVIDGMYADNFDANETLADVFNPNGRFGGGVYNRYTLNMTSGAIDVVRMSKTESEFPTFNPRVAGRQHEACYTACSVDNGANSFFNAFQKVSFDGASTLVTLPPGHYGSEPLFAPATDARREDDGFVLEVVYDAYEHRSECRCFVQEISRIESVDCR
ncbi:MAG: lignostilbene alpha-beta-dioxygenase [Gammaproteobacteria bacterium]|nr:lignostilbene alpha-beta-dioxygenase [Gammaproteobacteria bacterium]